MRNVVPVLIGLVCLVQPVLPAQQVGQRVRITASRYDLHQQTGQVLAMNGDTLTVRLDGFRTVRFRQTAATDTLVLSRFAIDQLEVRARGGHRTGRGALIGGSIGVVAGFVIGVATYKECTPEQSVACAFYIPQTQAEAGVLGAGALGLVCAGVGALIGAFSTGEEWHDVKIRRLPPQRVGLGVSIPF